MRITFLILLFISAVSIDGKGQSTGDIKIYFNNPVDTTVATGKNAIYLDNAIDDTLVAYINRAKYTIDVAVYNFSQSSGIADIAGAINAAHAAGKRVRWIYDGSASNFGVQNLNAGIPRLASPTTTDYGIMHNKFMIIDANSANDSDAIVWTGSTNWNSGQINNDVNNVVIIQDKSLAQAYTTEFNEMWGDTGLLADSVHSKFGPDKIDNTPHIFNIGGKTVECYFSPSDDTNDHILDVISSANSQIYFGIYTFTFDDDDDAYAIRSKIQNEGVYAAGIIDEFSETYDPYTILHPVMGNMLRVFYQSSTIYHNKLVVIDPCDYASDPLVETGSHNWTISANRDNDENALIIHDSTTANIFYQSFKRNFEDLGGTLADCSTIGVPDLYLNRFVNVFPNPSHGKSLITFDLPYPLELSLNVSDVTGRIVYQKKINVPGNIYREEINFPGNGFYFLNLISTNGSFVKKIIVE